MAGSLATWARALGGGRLGVWAIKHVVSPLDRRLYVNSGGRLLSTGRPLAPVLLLSTVGRRTGRIRTTPVFYLREGERLILPVSWNTPGGGMAGHRDLEGWRTANAGKSVAEPPGRSPREGLRPSLGSVSMR